jgi:hypothetical protein
VFIVWHRVVQLGYCRLLKIVCQEGILDCYTFTNASVAPEQHVHHPKINIKSFVPEPRRQSALGAQSKEIQWYWFNCLCDSEVTQVHILASTSDVAPVHCIISIDWLGILPTISVALEDNSTSFTLVVREYVHSDKNNTRHLSFCVGPSKASGYFWQSGGSQYGVVSC